MQHEVLAVFPSSASTICSSWPVPSVVTASAWVSPRVNSADPCASGSTPTSARMGRTVLVSRPSMRRPVSRTAPRTMDFSSALTSAFAALASCPSSVSAHTASERMRSTLCARVCLSVSRYASSRRSRAKRRRRRAPPRRRGRAGAPTGPSRRLRRVRRWRGSPLAIPHGRRPRRRASRPHRAHALPIRPSARRSPCRQPRGSRRLSSSCAGVGLRT